MHSYRVACNIHTLSTECTTSLGLLTDTPDGPCKSQICNISCFVSAYEVACIIYILHLAFRNSSYHLIFSRRTIRQLVNHYWTGHKLWNAHLNNTNVIHNVHRTIFQLCVGGLRLFIFSLKVEILHFKDIVQSACTSFKCYYRPNYGCTMKVMNVA